MKLREAQVLFSKNVASLIQHIFSAGWEITLGECLRTPEQQDLYLKQGLTKTKNSQHLKKLAIDLNFFLRGVYITDTAMLQGFGKYWVSLHPANRWGGDWNKNGKMSDESFLDGNHFEMVF